MVRALATKCDSGSVWEQTHSRFCIVFMITKDTKAKVAVKRYDECLQIKKELDGRICLTPLSYRSNH